MLVTLVVSVPGVEGIVVFGGASECQASSANRTLEGDVCLV